MTSVSVQFLGCGDNFGSGGRLHTCFLVRAGGACFMVDCGASALIGARRFGVDPDAVDLILLSHLHGDHFGGVPFFLLDAQLISRRERPLLIAGPEGTARRLEQLTEAMFPGAWSEVHRRFELELRELRPGHREQLADDVAVTPFLGRHHARDPALALRVECAGKVLTYSGDTEWVDALVLAADGADVFIAEAYYYDKRIPFHLSYATLVEHAAQLNARRTVLTHMSADMLGRLDALGVEAAEDGLLIEL